MHFVPIRGVGTVQNPTTVCGNCGKPVSDSDVTCPHCDVLLAAYASPSGSTTAHVYASSEPIAGAVPSAEMYVPAPAPPIEIPDEVEVVSTAPRPLFATNLTIEDIARAAESDHDEPLVVVKDARATKPVVFDVPSYAKPPSDAAPIPVVDAGEEDMIARVEEPPQPAKPGSPQKPAPPVKVANANDAVVIKENQPQESWLYDLGRSGPTPLPQRAPRERMNRPEPARTTTLPPSDRGTTEAYLRKLHRKSGYETNATQLSQPVDAMSARTGTGWIPGISKTKETEGLEKSRKGCLFFLYIVLFFMWLGVITGILLGDLSPGLLMLAVVLSFATKFLRKPLASVRRR